jgi:hypothetical protein
MLRLACLLSLTALPVLADPLVIELSFSDKALAELRKRGEMVTVAAYFMGDPAPGNTLPLTPVDTVFLQSQEVTLWPGPQRVVLGENLALAPMDQVTVAMANVNIYTARLTDEMNLIDCGFRDAPLTELTAAPQAMVCKLIGE